MITTEVSKYKQHESPHVRNRATIVLMTIKGNTPAEIANEVGLSETTVKKWQNAWDVDGIGIFPQLEHTTEDKNDVPGDVSDKQILDNREEATENAMHGLLFPDLTSLEADYSMVEAGRNIMLKQLYQMLVYEPIALKGKDIEGVHQMRVATRRWRSAYSTFGDYLPKAYIGKIYRDLRNTAKLLGEVRDLDVFLDKMRKYLKNVSDADKTALEPLIKIIKKDRRKARKQLFKWLDSQNYQRFVKRAFKKLSQETVTTQSDHSISARLDHVLPVIIYQRLEAVRRYEDVLPDVPVATLHELRIDCKRLRYTLEVFEDVLGDEVSTIIEALRLLQDHLGDLNDAEIAANIIRSAEKRVTKSERSALKDYRKYRQAEVQHLQETIEEKWIEFNRQDLRHALAQAIAVL